MAIRNIFKAHEPILRKTAKPVEVFDEKLWQLLDDMQETLIKADGAGIAGNQVGVLKRVCILSIMDENIELVNPEITKMSKESNTYSEGCLSICDEKGNLLYDEVERPSKITVKFYDRFGKRHVRNMEGFLARCACHEIDHLNGILYIDRVKEKE